MNQSDLTRNRYMLRGSLAKRGYDWWWHNFTAYKKSTGEAKAFFIEYFICNPALGSAKPILGQLPKHQQQGVLPSYAMIKVGYWGEQARQIHNFYGIDDWQSADDKLDIRVGECRLTEQHIQGVCRLSEHDAQQHPEYMSDAGELIWDLRVDKQIAFHVGYGASPLFRRLQAFDMFWHAEGIKTLYSGLITLNGEEYDVIPETSFGYADKNWGTDFTSPWLWISSCNLHSKITGKTLTNSALELGGGQPKIYGVSLGRKLLGCLYYEGEMFEYNFAKFWTGTQIKFEFIEGETENQWHVNARNRTSRMELTLTCQKADMLLINYEAPNGRKRHNRLWNGGTGVGEIKLYRLTGKAETLIDHLTVANAGCEYGEYGEYDQ